MLVLFSTFLLRDLTSLTQWTRSANICIAPWLPTRPQSNKILHYLWATTRQGLLLRCNSSMALNEYSNADWAGCPDDRKSTSSFSIFLAPIFYLGVLTSNPQFLDPAQRPNIVQLPPLQLNLSSCSHSLKNSAYFFHINLFSGATILGPHTSLPTQCPTLERSTSKLTSTLSMTGLPPRVWTSVFSPPRIKLLTFLQNH